MFKIMVLNLGATSSKVSIYQDHTPMTEQVIRHTSVQMELAPTNREQVALRAEIIRNCLKDAGITLNEIDAVAMRGGGMDKATISGTYQMNDHMRKDVYKLYAPDEPFLHGARIVLPILDEILGGKEIPIYITDPPYVDEFCPEAKISGHPQFTRLCRFQALNHKQVGRKVALELGKRYETSNIVVAHMGGGVSVGAHQQGKIIDCNDCTDGDGPFSPERAGSVPVGQLISTCFSGQYTERQVRSMIRGNGGVRAYLGTSDMREAEEKANQGDATAKLIINAFIYQVSKEIGACAAVLHCKVDAIVLTGGIAYSNIIAEGIGKRVGTLAPVFVYPGEGEAEALVNGALRVLRKEIQPIPYQ